MFFLREKFIHIVLGHSLRLESKQACQCRLHITEALI